MNEECEEVYKMQKWTDDDLISELSRPVSQPLNLFQTSLEREVLSRIFKELMEQKDER